MPLIVAEKSVFVSLKNRPHLGIKSRTTALTKTTGINVIVAMFYSGIFSLWNTASGVTNVLGVPDGDVTSSHDIVMTHLGLPGEGEDAAAGCSSSRANSHRKRNRMTA